jgi:hypothetical protein|tara:strand:+ start:312 stop:464 length:153 start_codon:yes stop_codon:yes gene_type:complete
MTCPKCNKNMIWGGDHDYEDDQKIGVVSNHTCPNEECSVDMVLIYDNLDE